MWECKCQVCDRSENRFSFLHIENIGTGPQLIGSGHGWERKIHCNHHISLGARFDRVECKPRYYGASRCDDVGQSALPWVLRWELSAAGHLKAGFRTSTTPKAFHPYSPILTQIHAILPVAALQLVQDIIFGIFADCTATVGYEVPSLVFARVDMGLESSVDFGRGVVQIGGQQTSHSFILDPDCYLTGGFALCHWFGDASHDGDRIFTIGGYHSAFRKPDWYWASAGIDVETFIDV